MTELIAIVNVIAWAFWYLALSAEVGDTGQMVTAAPLAALGGAVGILAYFQLVRRSEATGYARAPGRAAKHDEYTGEES